MSARPTRSEVSAALAAAVAWPVAVLGMLLAVHLMVAVPAQQADAVRVAVFYGAFGWPVVAAVAGLLPRLRHWWPDFTLGNGLRAGALTASCAAVLGLCLIVPSR